MILNHSSVVCLDSCSCERKEIHFLSMAVLLSDTAFSSPSDVAHIVAAISHS